MQTLKTVADEGFDESMVESVLNIVEMSNKEQKPDLGMQLTESLIGFFNFQNYEGIKNYLNISSKLIN